jgi:hypothetical protein
MSLAQTFQQQNPSSVHSHVEQNLATKETDLERNDDASEKHDASNKVDWDGLDDPANPMNWSATFRVGHVVLVSAMTLIVYDSPTILSIVASNIRTATSAPLCSHPAPRA